MRDDFAVFILSHGRADNVVTLKALEQGNYTGKIYIVIDNEDSTAERYKELYGDKVIMFDKLAVSKTFDNADNFGKRNSIVFARNVCFDLAKNLGLKYFLELDDDYDRFIYKYVKKGNKLDDLKCRQLDRLFENMLRFLDASGALCVALAQNGDYVGGIHSGMLEKGIKRKAMNTLFLRTDKPFHFVGTINEDVNTYVTLGQRGHLFLTVARASIHQKITQSNKGGMTDIYLDSGTYVKSFYSVMMAPSCVKIAEMGNKNKRIHHKVLWNYCTPKILSEKHKKNRGNHSPVL